MMDATPAIAPAPAAPAPAADKGKAKLGAGGAAPPLPPPNDASAPWVEKYRPQTLDDVCAHRDIIDTS
jgi:replication factor C subunit 3/5